MHRDKSYLVKITLIAIAVHLVVFSLSCSQPAKILNNRSVSPSNAMDNGSDSDAQQRELSLSSEAFSPRQMVRLTKEQYLGTVKAVFNLSDLPAVKLPGDEDGEKFRTFGPPRVHTGEAGVALYFDASFSIARKILSDSTFFDSCSGDDFTRPCMENKIEEAAFLLFRGQDYKDYAARLYNSINASLPSATSDAALGLEYALAALLQHPNFLYQTFYGEGEAAGTGYAELNAFEFASKLSFLILNRGPDQDLLSQAEDIASGKKEKTALVNELLGKEEGRDFLSRFLSDLLHVSKLKADTHADADWSTLYPLFIEEFNLTVNDIVHEKNADIRQLMTSSETFANNALADIYQINADLGNAFEKVTMGDNNRAGIITSGAVLAANSTTYTGNATHRGIFLNGNVLCIKAPDFPTDQEEEINEFIENMPTTSSLREHVDLVLANPSCKGCHMQFDPVGMLFDGYTSIGSIDTEHEVHNQATVKGKDFNGIADLLKYYADKPDIPNCMAENFGQFIAGEFIDDSNAGELIQLFQETMQSSDNKLKDFAVAILSHPGFSRVTGSN